MIYLNNFLFDFIQIWCIILLESYVVPSWSCVQNDKDAAFLVLKRFEDSIGALSEYMNDLNPKIKKEKTEIQKLKKSILYMKNTVEYIRKNI